MADPLSISASIAGLITLADVAVSRTCKFIKSCRSAVKDASRLLKEVQNLLGILRGLHSLSSQIDNAQLSTHIPTEQIHHCEATLRKIQTKLADSDPSAATSRLQKLERTLKWPFTSSETSEMLSDLASYKETFDLTISMDVLESVLIQSSAQEEMGTDIKEIKRDVRELCRIQMSKERQRILELFAIQSVKSNQHMNRKLRHPGTGSWFLDGPVFQKWLSERKSKLWLCGIPGAGKSVLTAAAIDETLKQASSSFAILYMYCDYKDSRTQDPVPILAGLVEQLARQSEKCFDLLHSKFKAMAMENSSYGLPEVDDLVNLLLEMADCFDDVAVLVDGLDECEQAGEMASILADLTEQSNVKLLISSRDESNIRQELQDFESVEVSAQEHDLRLFVASEIELRTRKRKLQIQNSDLKETILERLVTEAAGMFRWVVCQIDHLCDLPDDAARRTALEDLPQGLYPTYERIMERINRKHHRVQTLVEKALKWLVRDQKHIKPLTGAQLCAAVAVRDGDEVFDPEAMPTLERIAFHCSSLVRFSDNEQSLELAHYSVEQFLRNIDPATKSSLAKYAHVRNHAESFKATTCLTFVLTHQLASLCREFKDLCQRSEEFPFFQHAASAWPYYTGERSPSPTEFQLMQRLFNPNRTPTFESWAQMFGVVTIGLPLVADVSTKDERITDFMRQTALATSCTPLQYAAIIGSTPLIEWLVHQGSNIDVKNLLGPPLFCSITGKGAFGVVTSDEDDPEFDPHAQRLENTFVGFHFHPDWSLAVRALLMLGADVSFNINHEGKRSRSILCLAIEMACVDVLMQCGFPLDNTTLEDVLADYTQPCPGLQQLIDSLGHDHLLALDEVKVKELKERQSITQPEEGSSSREPSPAAQTPANPHSMYLQKADLRHACEVGDVSVMVYLLEEFDLNVDDGLLQIATRHSQIGAVECLLKYGADVNPRGDVKNSPLVVYFKHSRDIRILKLLLSQGANVSLADDFGHAAVIHCCNRGDLDEFDCILNSGVDLTELFDRRENLLHEIVKSSTTEHYELVQTKVPKAQFEGALLQQDWGGLLPLHVAAQLGRKNMLQLLLRDTPNLNIVDNDGRNAGHFVARYPTRAGELLRPVGAAGVSLAARSNDNSTALHISLQAIALLDDHDKAKEWASDYEQVVQELVASSSIVHTARNDGATPMHVLCETIVSISEWDSCNHRSHCGACQMLLNLFKHLLYAGADMAQEDESGQSSVEILVDGLYRDPPTDRNRIIAETLVLLVDVRSANSLAAFRLKHLPLLNIVARTQEYALCCKLMNGGSSVDERPQQSPPEPEARWLEFNYSPIELLCKHGCSEEVIKVALQKSQSLQDIGPSGKGLLHLVANREHCDEPSIKRLVDSGMNVNSVDDDGLTPLMVAVRANHDQHVAALLQNGASLADTDPAGTSVAAQACKEGSTTILKLMTPFSSFWTANSTLQLGAMTKKETRTVTGPKRSSSRNTMQYSNHAYSGGGMYSFTTSTPPPSAARRYTPYAAYAPAYEYTYPQYTYAEAKPRRHTYYSRRDATYEPPPPYSSYSYTPRPRKSDYQPVSYHSYSYNGRTYPRYYDPYYSPAQNSPRSTYEYVEDTSVAKPEKTVTKTVTVTIKHEVVDRITRQAYKVGPLELCVFHKHHEAVKYLLAEMKQSSAQSSLGAGVSGLFVACWNNDVTAAKLLIKAAVDVNQAEPHYKLTPFHVAVARGSDSLIKVLLNAGCNRFAADISGRTAIYYAFKHGQTSIAKQVLAHKSNHASVALNDTKDVEDNLTPPVALISAAAFEKLLDDREEDLVRLLVSSGYSVDAPVPCGCPPLLQMLIDTNTTMAKLLLDLGASALGHACKSVKWNRHRANYTAYHYAVQKTELFPVLKRLLDNVELCELSVRDSPAHPLHIAILNRNQKALVHILKRYEKAGSPGLPSARSQQSPPEPLKATALDGDHQVVQTNGEESTPATKMGHQESTEEPLEAKGTSSDTQDDDGLWSWGGLSKPSRPPKLSDAVESDDDPWSWGLSKPSRPPKLSNAVESDDDPWSTTRKKKRKGKLKQAQKAKREAEQNNDVTENHDEQNPKSMPTNSGSRNSLLLRAVLERSISKSNIDAEFYLAKDMSIKTIPPGTPLHIAAHIGYLDAVQLLLKAGATIDVVDENLETPLHYAVAGRNLEMAQLLVDHGANVNARDRTGSSMSHKACVRGGDIKILSMLYTAGADLRSRDSEGRTPLHIACRESKVDVVDYLSSLGLDLTAKDCRGTRPLDLVVRLGLHRSLAFVLRFISGHPELPPSQYILAQAWRDARTTELGQIAKHLQQDDLALYANAYSREAEGTPLYLAASAGQVRICDMLREYGALINLEGGVEGTPLMAACYHGRIEAVKYLVRAGAETSYLTQQRLLVSAIVAAKHFPDIVSWLLVRRYTEQKFLTLGQAQENGAACATRIQWRLNNLDVVFQGDWAAYARSHLICHTLRSFICSSDGHCEVVE